MHRAERHEDRELLNKKLDELAHRVIKVDEQTDEVKNGLEDAMMILRHANLEPRLWQAWILYCLLNDLRKCSIVDFPCGSGKSACCRALAKSLLANWEDKKIILACPTELHKMAEQFSMSHEIKAEGIEFMTHEEVKTFLASYDGEEELVLIIDEIHDWLTFGSIDNLYDIVSQPEVFKVFGMSATITADDQIRLKNESSWLGLFGEETKLITNKPKV